MALIEEFNGRPYRWDMNVNAREIKAHNDGGENEFSVPHPGGFRLYYNAQSNVIGRAATFDEQMENDLENGFTRDQALMRSRAPQPGEKGIWTPV